MGLRERTVSAFRVFRDPTLINRIDPHVMTRTYSNTAALPTSARYELLRMHLEATVYSDLRNRMGEIMPYLPSWFDGVTVSENPALQAVEFHLVHVLPGALADALPFALPEDDSLSEACRRILVNSNFGAQKDVMVEEQVGLGDAFLQAVRRDDGSSYILVVAPDEVTDFAEDSRGNMSFVRTDVELEADDDTIPQTRTEVWDKQEGVYRLWISEHAPGTPLDELGPPRDERDQGERVERPELPLTAFGYNFVPFVRAPFRRGRPSVRSRGVFESHLEAITSHLRSVTDLRNLFRENGEGLWATTPNDPDKPAINFRQRPELIERAKQREDRPSQPEEYTAHGRRIIDLPGRGRIEDLVPKIDYDAGLSMTTDSRQALERSLAELRYFRGIEGGDPSAAAIRAHQGPAIARAEQARGIAEEAVAKVLAMCLTMSQVAGAEGFNASEVGTFERGEFGRIQFRRRPIVPVSPTERLAEAQLRAEVWQMYAEIGHLAHYLENEEGYTTEEAQELASRAAQSSQSNSGRRALDDILGG